MNASVKVMRSYDYCHFEVCLGIDNAATDADVDELRKRAARLVDKAVEQYKIAKNIDGSRHTRKHEWERLREECRSIETLPDGDRTPKQMAKLKLLQDRDWQKYINERYDRYDYQDDWNEQDDE